jgi:phosphopantetheinyl transferase (holo-ACP synthase)
VTPAVTVEGRRAPARLAASSRVVHLPAGGSRADLLRGCPPALVYTRAEQRYCDRRQDLTGWAGRLAAKLAVADLFGIDADAALEARRDVGLQFVEILPSPSVPCPDGAGCTKPHPPDVRFLSESSEGFGITRREDESVKVSISHTRRMALALAPGHDGGLRGRRRGQAGRPGQRARRGRDLEGPDRQR